MAPEPSLSVVLPVLNEQDSLEPLHGSLSAVLKRLDRSYEVIYVDDGSTDDSWGTLRRLAASDAHIRLLRLRRNFGQTSALAAGFAHARFPIVITLDADGQNDPADIPGLIEGAAEGAGLGHQFLRHLQRTRLLLHLVDMAPFDEGTDPVAEVKAIAAELKKYDASLGKKARWLVFNKADLLDEKEAKRRAAEYVKRLRWTKPWFVVSAISGEGTKEVTYKVMEFLEGGGRRKAEGDE